MTNKGDLREEDTTMLKEQKEIYLRTIEDLQVIWEKNHEELRRLQGHPMGIRSSQVGALVILLIKKGILK